MSTKTEDLQTYDRWLYWPYLVVFVYPVIIATLTAFDFPWTEILFVVPAMLAGILLIFALPFLIYRLRKNGASKQRLSIVLLPVFMGVVLICTGYFQQLGYITRFYAIRDSLQAEVDRTSGKDSEKLVIFLTDGFLDTSFGYAYDGSDELGLPAGKQSDAWKRRAFQTEFEDLCFDATHISGHFYMWDTTHGCDPPK